MKIVILLVVLGAACYTEAMDGISLRQGLTSAEQNFMLDEHNRIRIMQAKGEIPGQPPAADLTRLEWDEGAARHAQEWANNCGGPMHGNDREHGEGQCYQDHGDRSILIKMAFEGWFDREYPMYRYGSPPGSAGHYTQIVTSYSTGIGCGANKCEGYPRARLICNFRIGGNLDGQVPFKQGPACSKCPVGFGFCKDSLCTSGRVCRRGDSSCRCTVDSRKCAAHGTYNANTCECTCNRGWTGLNCDEECADVPNKACHSSAKGGKCQPSASNPFYTHMMLRCPASCRKCEPPCKNVASDCSQQKEWGNCQRARDYMEMNCAKECGFCT